MNGYLTHNEKWEFKLPNKEIKDTLREKIINGSILNYISINLNDLKLKFEDLH